MFAYFHNNPVNMSDESGYLPKWLKKAAKAVKNTVTKVVKTVANVVRAVNSALGTLKGTIAKASNEVISTVTKYLGKDKRYKEYLGKYQGMEIDCVRFGYKKAAKVGVST